MPLAPEPSPVLHFGPFCLDPAAARLSRSGQPVALRPKAFELLLALTRRPGELHTKEQLLDAVWGRRFITEGVIKAVVTELRSALGDDPREPQWIQTVPRRGYRFSGAVDSAAARAFPASPAAAVAALPAARDAGNLPLLLPELLGRSVELESLAGLLRQHRLVTLAGPAGVGKTRLAQACAAAQRQSWPAGVWFVELAALSGGSTDEAALCALIVQVLRLKADGGAAALARALRPLSLLLVLDNAEHVLEALAPLLHRLLAEAPLVRMLVTSQEPVHVAGEQVCRLSPLALPSADDAAASVLMDAGAVQLFVDRVAARLQGFTLAPQQQRTVAAICRALDGMPLALELAAARVPALGVHGIAELLLGEGGDARLQLLTQGSRGAVQRQRTLRDAMQWSYELLDDVQQRVFRRLGVFRGSIGLPAAQTVCSDATLDAWAVLDAIDALVDKSLLTPLAMLADAADPSPPRFSLLESLREFALEKLVAAGEMPATRDRHLAHWDSHWQEQSLGVFGVPVLRWTRLEGRDIDNLRGALRWAGTTGRDDVRLGLVAHSALLWCHLGLGPEYRMHCESVRAHAAATAQPALRRALDLALATAVMYASVLPPAVGLDCALRARVELEQAGEIEKAYFACYLVYQLCIQAQVEAGRAEALQRMALLEQPHWNPLLKRFRRTLQGYSLRQREPQAYLAYCEREVELCRRIGAERETWAATQGLMLAYCDIDDVPRALEVGRRALDEIRHAGLLTQSGAFNALWITLLAASGAHVQSRRALQEALPGLRSAGMRWMAQLALALTAAHEGRHADGARLLGWHDAALRQGRIVGSGAAIVRARLALVALLEQHLSAADLARQCDAGAALSDDAAEALALGSAG